MDLNINTTEGIKKKYFTLNPKPLVRGGLVLRLHHTDSNSKKLRFLHTCFNDDGDILATSDNDGNLFFINIRLCKFWGLPTVKSCTLLAFSPFKSCEVLIGQRSNEIFIVNFENGLITAKLFGHESAPNYVSFAPSIYCLSASKTEALLWNLQNCMKLKILALEKGSCLLYASILPDSNNIFVCYTDNLINIWKFGSFKMLKSIPASTWCNVNMKHFSFSNDGCFMASSGIGPCVAIYSLKTWKVLKFVNLPENIKTIRSLKFVSSIQSGGPILAILSGHGVLSFLDLLDNTIISELKTKNEIIMLDTSKRTHFLGCLLCVGEIEIYDISMYSERPTKVIALTEKRMKIKLNQKFNSKKVLEHKEEVNGMLNIDKLRSILKEYGEYPENYRAIIWEQLLQLPHNKREYDKFIKSHSNNALESLDRAYPVESRSFKCLRCLLNNLVTWCGFFSHVHYLPLFVYPFLKVFQNKPLVCFEAIATILLNWCQYWFEYFPLPPINVLAIVENMFLEWDPQLLKHVNNYGITSKQYAWPLLETAFSEVLTSQSWFVLWDHVLTNEPSFLLCTIVGYSIIQRKILLNIKETKELEDFYHKQTPLDLKGFMRKCYKIMDETDPGIHPRKYLNMFANIEKGIYPIFHGYPKVMIDNETKKLNDLKNELSNIKLEEVRVLLDKKKQIDKVLSSELENVEKKRMYEMKKACSEKLQDRKIKANYHLQRFDKLSKKFDEHQTKVMKFSRIDSMRKRVSSSDNFICSEIDRDEKIGEYLDEKVENLLLQHYSELIKHKLQIEALLQDESNAMDEPQLYEAIRREHTKILREMRKISESPDAEKRIRHYNIVSSLLAIDDLIHKVEFALAKELSRDYLDLTKSERCFKATQLRAETEQLETEVGSLLKILSKCRIEDYRPKISSFTISKYIQPTASSYQSLPSQLGSRISSESCPLSTDTIKKMKRLKMIESDKSVKFGVTK